MNNEHQEHEAARIDQERAQGLRDRSAHLLHLCEVGHLTAAALPEADDETILGMLPGTHAVGSGRYLAVSFRGRGNGVRPGRCCAAGSWQRRRPAAFEPARDRPSSCGLPLQGNGVSRFTHGAAPLTGCSAVQVVKAVQRLRASWSCRTTATGAVIAGFVVGVVWVV